MKYLNWVDSIRNLRVSAMYFVNVYETYSFSHFKVSIICF